MRRVRTSEGSRYYGLPIGAPITTDDIARARERNKGKPAPKGATSRVRSPASPKVRRAAQQKVQKEAAAKSRLVSPVVKVAPPPKPKKGGTKVKAGRTEYSVDKDSRSFTREGSNVVYNVGSDGTLRVLAPKGEARLTPEQESKVKALMMAERSSFTEVTVTDVDKEPTSGRGSKDGREGEAGVPAVRDSGSGDRGREGGDRGTLDSGADQGGSGDGSVTIAGRSVATVGRIETTNRQAVIAEAGGSTPPLFELEPINGARFFREQLLATKEGPYSAAVYAYDEEDYAQMRLFLDESGTSGVALKGDEIVSVFNKSGGPNKRVARHLIAAAVEQGGKRLDAFDTVLPEIYALEGFQPVARVPFDDEYAPEGWDYEAFGPFNGGRPDVVFMAHNSAAIDVPYEPGAGERVSSYDEGVERAKQSVSTPSAGTGLFNEYDPSARAESGSEVENTPLSEMDGYERDQEVTVYRGIPSDADSAIRPGDWVTPNEQLAKDYAGTGKVVSMKVKAQNLKVDPDDDSMEEMVFSPERIPDSLGESVVVDGGDLLDMKKSPLTSPHILPNGEFTPERKALHDKIIAQFFEGVAPVANPTQFMNGGGPASGKGTMTRGDNAKITGYPPTNIVDDFGNFQKVDNPGGVIVDPDQLKLSLPEGQKAVKDFADGVERTEEYQEWAANLHGESSYLGQRLAQAALERGVNIILDGVNDGSVEGVTRKVMKARALGYRVEANYIYLDPREALDRAMSRAARAGRRVPPSIILGAYSKLPGIFDGIKDGLFDKVRLFDNNVEGSNAYMLGEGSRDSDFSFLEPEFEEVYERFLESSGIAKEMLGLQEVESGAAKAQEENLKDLSEPPKS